jgi:2-oxo-3-hexenedioate decarboxylase
MTLAHAQRIEEISKEAIALLGTGRQVVPFGRRYPEFNLNEAYDVVSRVRDLRRERGETPIGRKIGFTNRAIWSGYGISGPIWNYMFDRTVSRAACGRAEFELKGMAEPRIEPEVVLHLASAPSAGMDADGLISCVDWVAPAFEIVFSVFPNWSFSAADAAAAYGVHGALLLGSEMILSESRSVLSAALSKFTLEMESGRGVRRDGCAGNVLGGPLQALKFLVDEIAQYPMSEPLKAGEIVTTGTLTEAMPAEPGDTWSVRFKGINLEPLQLHFR